VAAANREKVAAYLAENPRATSVSAAEALDLSRQAVASHATALGIKLALENAAPQQRKRAPAMTVGERETPAGKKLHPLSCARSGCGWSGPVTAYAAHRCRAAA